MLCHSLVRSFSFAAVSTQTARKLAAVPPKSDCNCQWCDKPASHGCAKVCLCLLSLFHLPPVDTNRFVFSRSACVPTAACTPSWSWHSASTAFASVAVSARSVHMLHRIDLSCHDLCQLSFCPQFVRLPPGRSDCAASVRIGTALTVRCAVPRRPIFYNWLS